METQLACKMAQRGGSHGYCLKWKYHPNNLLHMFNQLLLNESFTDVLVACEGKTIKCHKVWFNQKVCKCTFGNDSFYEAIVSDFKENSFIFMKTFVLVVLDGVVGMFQIL